MLGVNGVGLAIYVFPRGSAFSVRLLQKAHQVVEIYDAAFAPGGVERDGGATTKDENGVVPSEDSSLSLRWAHGEVPRPLWRTRFGPDGHALLSAVSQGA